MSEVKLHLGDCLEVMKSIPDKSVDAVITDPPYYRIVDHDWDKQWQSLDEYLDWLEIAAVEWRRIIKDNGSIYLFADDKVCAYIQTRFDKHFLLLNNLVWFKTINMARMYSNGYRCYAPTSERILFYSAQYDPTGWDKKHPILTLWPDLKPEEVKPRNIKAMHNVYGVMEGKRCGSCTHFLRIQYSKVIFKCALARISRSSATDWRARWTACGRYEETKDKTYISPVKS